MDGSGEVYKQGPKGQSVADILVAQSHQMSKDKVTEYQFDLQKAYDQANDALEVRALRRAGRVHVLDQGLEGAQGQHGRKAQGQWKL